MRASAAECAHHGFDFRVPRCGRLRSIDRTNGSVANLELQLTVIGLSV